MGGCGDAALHVGNEVGDDVDGSVADGSVADAVAVGADADAVGCVESGEGGGGGGRKHQKRDATMRRKKIVSESLFEVVLQYVYYERKTQKKCWESLSRDKEHRALVALKGNIVGW